MAAAQKSREAKSLEKRIRLDEVLFRRASVIAEHHGMSVNEWIAQLLWPIVRKELPRVARELVAEDAAAK